MKRNLLVLEDDSQLLLLYNRVLTKADYYVFLARTIATAKERLKTHDIDLLICDLNIDQSISVHELKEELADMRQRNIPVVVISGYTDMRKECESFGWTFVAKPITVLQLVRIVSEALNAGAKSS